MIAVAHAQTALQKEKEDLQQKLAQAEKDLAEARSTQPTTGAAASGDATNDKVTELQAKCDALQKDKDAYDAVSDLTTTSRDEH